MEYPEIQKKAERLISKNRSRCLWFLKDSFLPTDPFRLIHTLGYIELYGDFETFKEARQLKTWLLQHFKRKSAG